MPMQDLTLECPRLVSHVPRHEGVHRNQSGMGLHLTPGVQPHCNLFVVRLSAGEAIAAIARALNTSRQTIMRARAADQRNYQQS